MSLLPHFCLISDLVLPHLPHQCYWASPAEPPCTWGAQVLWGSHYCEQSEPSCFQSEAGFGRKGRAVMRRRETTRESGENSVLGVLTSCHIKPLCCLSAALITVTKSFVSVYSPIAPKKDKSKLFNLCVWFYPLFAPWSCIFFKTVMYVFWESDREYFWWIWTHMTCSAKVFFDVCSWNLYFIFFDCGFELKTSFFFLLPSVGKPTLTFFYNTVSFQFFSSFYLSLMS